MFEKCSIFQLLDAAITGYNVTIMAYGQTGSGKTHTLSGKIPQKDEINNEIPSADPGIILGGAEYLFSILPSLEGFKCTLRASYLEIYNEGVYDLVHNRNKSLPVKWSPSKGFHVPGLKVMDCSTIKSLKDIISTGLQNRRVGSHELNSESSRGHTILTIHCFSTPSHSDSTAYAASKCGKVSFVDLAGSERLKDSQSSGDVLKETTNINKSLFNLGKVISALAERYSSPECGTHIPYRDSVLTKLLMDSLGGSAFALMIACCSPAPGQIEETLSTLTYATRAKGIVNRPIVQYTPGDVELVALKSEVQYLREENKELRNVLRDDGLSVLMHGNPPPEPTILRRGSYGGEPSSCSRWMIPSHPISAINREDHHLQRLSSASFLGQELRRAGSAPFEIQTFSQLQAQHCKQNSVVNSSRASYGHMLIDSESNLACKEYLHAHPTPNNHQETRTRLMDTQAILTQFTEENSHLAEENNRLRKSGEQMMNSSHILYEEINLLKSKLSRLESTVMQGESSRNPRVL